MYQYEAKILSVYDGDGVFDANIDMGMNLWHRKDLRLYRVDTPELRGNHRKAGLVVRDFVRELILGKTVVINTQRDKTGKYGRLLVDIQIISDDGHIHEDLSELLINKGYAKPYFGGKKDEWRTEELEAITRGTKWE